MRLRGPEIVGARTPAAYVSLHLAHCARVRVTPHARSESLVAYVNEGRWLADCPHCNGGIVVSPIMPDGRCWDCGGIYTTLVWPADFADIEDRLSQEPLLQQHWTPVKGER